jgi:hypothetical protein
MDKGEGYGACDELGTGDEREECDVRNKPGRGSIMPRLPTVGDIKTRSIRVQMTDLDLLQRLKEGPDETPGDVIHRVVNTYLDPHRGQNSVIEKQSEEITALREKIGEYVLGAITGDQASTFRICEKRDVTVSITIEKDGD